MRALAVSLLVSSTALASGALHVDGGFFRDTQGGVVILRGVDVAGNAKVPPFTPIQDLSLLDPLPRWGLNAMRLVFTWEAYEPQPGQYSDAYLGYIRNVVAAAHARGMYVVIDFHQDGYSRYSARGCGEGFPSWALPPGIAPVTPDNGPACVNWGDAITGDATLKASWDGFYADAGGVRSAFLAMVGRVASALSVEPGVIGYDMLNEPAGDEVTQIGPLYEDAAKAIRAGDRNAILFVSPGLITGAGIKTRLQKPTFDNFAFAPHFYDATVHVGAWNGSDESYPIAQVTSAARDWNVPVFLGEFGAPPSTDGIDGYLSAVNVQLANNFYSSAQWAYTPGWTPTAKDGWDLEDFSIVDDKGNLRANFRPRPYVRRVAGTPVALSTAEGAIPSQSSVTFAWNHDPSAGATELFVPLAWFGGSASVYVQGNQADCSLDGEIVSCTSDTAGDKQLRIDNGRRCGLTGAEALLIVWLLRRRRRY
jgi:endoglycosylceramidase